MKRLTLPLIALVLMVLAVSATAAQTTRIDPTLNYIANTPDLIMTSYLGIPTTKSYSDIRSGNTQNDVNDPIHPCRGNGGSPGPGTYSVYGRLYHPGGTLTVSTVGSDYDTVVSIFATNGAGIISGTALACNDDTPALQAVVTATLPSAEYVVMISRYDINVASSPLGLTLTLSYVPDVAVPSNDDISAPTPLTVGIRTTTLNAQHASSSSSELALNDSACTMYSSVWYSFIPPETGYYRFNTYGTQIHQTLNNQFTVSAVAVYNDLMNRLGCAIGNVQIAVTNPLYLVRGSTYYVQVGSPYGPNNVTGTVYAVKPTIQSFELTKNNVGFDDGLLGWKTVNFDSGDMAMMSAVLINAGSVNKTISQTRANLPSYTRWTKTSRVQLSAGYEYNGTATGFVRVRINYSDGTAPTTVSVPLSNTLSSSTLNIARIVKPTSTRVKSVVVSAGLNAGTGTLALKYLYAQYIRDVLLTRNAPLPLPPAQ